MPAFATNTWFGLGPEGDVSSDLTGLTYLQRKATLGRDREGNRQRTPQERSADCSRKVRLCVAVPRGLCVSRGLCRLLTQRMEKQLNGPMILKIFIAPI